MNSKRTECLSCCHHSYVYGGSDPLKSACADPLPAMRGEAFAVMHGLFNYPESFTHTAKEVFCSNFQEERKLPED